MQAALVAAEEVNKAARRRRWTAWGRATLRDEYFGLLHEAQNPPEHRKKMGIDQMKGNRAQHWSGCAWQNSLERQKMSRDAPTIFRFLNCLYDKEQRP